MKYKKILGLPKVTTREKVIFINLYRNKEDTDYYDYLII